MNNGDTNTHREASSERSSSEGSVRTGLIVQVAAAVKKRTSNNGLLGTIRSFLDDAATA